MLEFQGNQRKEKHILEGTKKAGEKRENGTYKK